MSIVLGIIFAVAEVRCMADVTISKATVDNIAQIAAVHHSSWQAEFSEILPRNVVEKMTYAFCVAFWKEYFEKNDSKSETYVAKINNHIAGFIALIKSNNPEYASDSEIDKIYVAPEYQGLGIGSLLITYGLKRLQDKGFKRTIVKAFIENTKAQSFYEKLGGTYIKDAEIVDYHSTIKVKVYSFPL